MTCEPLIHRYLEFTQVAFWAGQEGENVFPVPGDQLEYPFVVLTKVEFWASQDEENDL